MPKFVHVQKAVRMCLPAGRTLPDGGFPVYADIDLHMVDRELAYVEAAGDLEAFCDGDELTQQAIAEDCNAHYASQYLTRAYVDIMKEEKT